MELTHVVAAIIIDDNKFFIAKRAKGKHLEGMYEFPGGKLLKNETHEFLYYFQMLIQFLLVAL